jgi:tetratricopeptide (TPR) repeat protein
MSRNSLEEKCALMSDMELLQAVTVLRGEYREDFLKIARFELEKRKINLSELSKRAKSQFGDEPEQIRTVEQILADLKEETKIWDLRSLTNFVEESLVIQKETLFWVLHYLFDGEYQASFLVDSPDMLEKLLPRFCAAEDWDSDLEETFSLDDWVIFVSSRSREYIETMATALEKNDIPFVVRDASFSRIFGLHEGAGFASINILIPEDYLDTARAVMDEIQKTIAALHKKAEELTGKGDPQQELEVYNYLVRLQPDDEIVFFNRGVLLFNRQQFEEAAHSFIQANLNAGKTGHLVIVEDTEAYLLRILENLPDNIEILQSLAYSSLQNGNPGEAEKYYQKILSLKPDDAETHLNLGHLYYQGEVEQNERALKHFQQYLELNPQAEDRGAIEAIIEDLK